MIDTDIFEKATRHCLRNRQVADDLPDMTQSRSDVLKTYLSLRLKSIFHCGKRSPSFSLLMEAFNGSGWLQASPRPGESTETDVTFSVPALGMEFQMEFYKRGRNVVLRKVHMKPERKGSLYNHLDRIVRGTPESIIHELKSITDELPEVAEAHGRWYSELVKAHRVTDILYANARSRLTDIFHEAGYADNEFRFIRLHKAIGYDYVSTRVIRDFIYLLNAEDLERSLEKASATIVRKQVQDSP